MVFLFSVVFFLLPVWAGTNEFSMPHPISLGLSNVYALERFRLRNAWIGHPFKIALLLFFSISFILESPDDSGIMILHSIIMVQN